MNASQTARTSTTQQTMIPNSPIAPTAAPVFEKQGFESSSYPDTRKFKLHPLYNQPPIFDDYPPHVSDFEPIPALAAERLLVKRESVYAPPATMSSLLSQRTDVASHDYYSRPPYSRPADPYPSQSINGGHAEMNGSNATIGGNYYPAQLVSWPDPFGSSSVPQSLNRRQPPSTLTPLTPVNAPVGQTSGSASSGSPPSQPTSASGSVPDQRPSTIAADPMYAPRRSVTYANGFSTNSGTPTPLLSSTYMQPSVQAQSAMYAHHTDGAQQQQLHLHQQQQQQQRQRQYHDGTVNADPFRQ
jgi:hypothetical protein